MRKLDENYYFNNYFRSNFFASSLDIILYNSSLLIMFCYLCKISENCQNMVCFLAKLVCFATEVILKTYPFQGKAVTTALHMPSNYQDQLYQRYVRIFSLQMREQPIRIILKQMFCFNYALLKSVRFYSN